MNKETRRKKDEGNLFKKYAKSLKHSIDGLIYAVENEINILFMMIGTIIVLILSFLLEVNTTELCLVVILSGLLMATELINCSIEATVDLITLEDNKLAKIAKDCGSSATFLILISYFFVIGIIFIPKIIDLF